MLFGRLIFAAPLLLIPVAFRVRKGMRWYIAVLWVALGSYALASADRLFFPLLVDPALRADNQYLEFSLGHWINFVPLKTIGQLLSMDSSTQAVRQIGGNLGLLFPSGIVLPALVPRLRKVWEFALVALALSVAIEVVQGVGTVTGVMNRSTDIDDVILNVLGALVGWGVWKAAAVGVAAYSRTRAGR